MVKEGAKLIRGLATRQSMTNLECSWKSMAKICFKMTTWRIKFIQMVKTDSIICFIRMTGLMK